MKPLAELTLADRFFWIIECLFKASSIENCRRRWMDWPLTLAFGNRMRRLRARFASLYARWKAGMLPAPRAGAARPADKPHPPEGPAASGPAASLPRAFAWLHGSFPRALPWQPGPCYPLFEDPEMLAFFAAAPLVGRILRPYLPDCRRQASAVAGAAAACARAASLRIGKPHDPALRRNRRWTTGGPRRRARIEQPRTTVHSVLATARAGTARARQPPTAAAAAHSPDCRQRWLAGRVVNGVL